MTSEATVSVRGEAILDAEPELAVVTIAAEARGGDHSTALSLLSERVKAVSDVVTRYAAGIERSETSRLTVYPELAHKKTEKVRRYVGHCTLSLTVHDFGVLSDLLVAARHDRAWLRSTDPGGGCGPTARSTVAPGWPRPPTR